MGEKGFEKKNGSADKDEAAISDFENEGGRVPSVEQKESGEETFVGRAAEYCRQIHGKILCRVGNHDYIEVRREKFHNGEDEVVHLQCVRSNCPNPKAWTEWRGGKQVL